MRSIFGIFLVLLFIRLEIFWMWILSSLCFFHVSLFFCPSCSAWGIFLILEQFLFFFVPLNTHAACNFIFSCFFMDSPFFDIIIAVYLKYHFKGLLKFFIIILAISIILPIFASLSKGNGTA